MKDASRRAGRAASSGVAAAVLLALCWAPRLEAGRPLPLPGAIPEVPVPEPKKPEPAAPDDGRQEIVRDAYHRATALAQSGDFAGAMKVLEEFGAKRGHDDPYYDELQGTVLALQKDYRGAQDAFDRELAKAPASYVARFNRAEMLMLQNHYDVAEREFGGLEKLRSKEDAPLADLCRFKRVICFLCEGDVTSADLLIPPVQESLESPALYYSRATLEFAKKHDEAAAKLLTDARAQFSKEVEALYTDSLVEMRWGQRAPDGTFVFKPRLP